MDNKISPQPPKYVGLRLEPLKPENGNPSNNTSEQTMQIVQNENLPMVPVPIPEEPQLTGCEKFLKAINSEQYWPLWIGLTWFLFIIGYSFWELDMPRFSAWTDHKSLAKTFTMGNFSGILLIMMSIALTLSIVHQSLNKPFGATQYIILILTVFLCSIIGSNSHLKSSGMGTSIWCIFLGILLRLIFYKGTVWFKSSTYDLEFFIKISIVLLSINLKEIGVIGAKALVVSWVETLLIIPIVYSIGYYLVKMCKEEALVTAAGVCICGSSAAMTIGDCVKVDKEALTSLIAVMSLLTIPCIPTLPLANVSDTILGSWIGGSVDSTGAVLASASLRSTEAAKVAIIIKMLQNIIIGVVALFVTFIWNKSCNIGILWTKLPKFVLGFILVAIITTVLPDYVVKRTSDNSFVISEWFAAISFVIIGFEIDILNIWSRIKAYKHIILLYVIGQTIDLSTTFGVSYLFMGVVK